MKQLSFHIVRVGVGITFIWIGILVFRSPEGWGSFLQPWAASLLPVPLREAMLATAVLDVVTGALLLMDAWTWLAALVGAVHIAIVLVTVGVNDFTVRDIGLLAATLALAVDAVPERLLAKLKLSR